MSFYKESTVWLKSAWVNTLTWFGLEEQRLASFLYPVLKDAKKVALEDVIDGVPVVAAALLADPRTALDVAIAYLLPLFEKQGIQLAQETLAVLANALVAQAKDAVAKEVASPAPAPAPAA